MRIDERRLNHIVGDNTIAVARARPNARDQSRNAILNGWV